MSFGDICDMYVKYISKKYVDPIIVFDGYESGPSTKDIAHIRRTHGVTGPNVAFNEATPFKGKKDSVLSNSENKQRFLNLLSERLLKAGYQVIHAVDDADVLIVKTAISCSEKSDTVVIGEDTDLLVLLCHHVPLENFNVYFWSEGKNISSKAVKCWDIKKTKVVLGESVCRCLPFLHAITGCDTTSRMFGISKGAALKKMNGDELKECAEVFNSNSSKDDIVKAGENAIVMLYGGVVIEGLDLLRFRKFVHKVTTSSKCVQVHTIPPTSAAAAYHSMRVYYQVQTWTRTSNDLVALDWGWSYDDNKLVPIKTHLAPAPESLLKIIRCSCKTGCDTKRCTCRKNGLDCSLGCGECRGVNCTNVSRAIELDAAEDMIA